MAKEEGRKKKGAGPAGREAVIPPAETGQRWEQGQAAPEPAPPCTHPVEGSPEQGLYLGCSHGWYRGCTPDSCWVEGYGCSVLVCSMRGFREGEQV